MLITLFLAMATSGAHAVDEDVVKPDARLEGYVRGVGQPPNSIVIEPTSGTATTWILFLLLSGICVLALSKSGKRTHLD